ncbi:MAG: CDP-glycerol glycerophosphotransferase family protein [Lachnospiraceae bacterium]|nr:CDP-glycerol glycerophosphotransferase family protein [Lachnospiraceae bacterium]
MTAREIIKKLSPKGIKNVYKLLRKAVIETEFQIFRMFPIQKKRVVLCNVWGFGDNVKWIAKALREADKSVEVVFVTDKKKAEHVPGGIKLLQTNSIRAVYYLATAHIWVDCNRKEPYIRKRPGQVYIQTWHGSLPLKRLEKDYPELPETYIKNAERDSLMTDLCLSNGEFMNDIYRKAFGYECEIAVTGSARLDPLFRPNPKRVIRTKNELIKLSGIAKTDTSKRSAVSGQPGNDDPGDNTQNIKIAVYAPTYREHGADFELPDLEKTADALEARFGGSFIIATRLHPLVASGKTGDSNGLNNSTRIVDCNSKGDLYELLEAADVLITDYSNTLFEFSLCGKPVFLYAPDAEAYEHERGFYFDYSKLPYPHSSDTAGLCESISEFSSFDYKNGLNDFFVNIGVKEDGRASRRIAELILRRVYRQ